MLQSAAASIMTMSLSPPASKNQKKQNSFGGSGSASPTPQPSAKVGGGGKNAAKMTNIFKRPIEEICRLRPPPDGRVDIPYVLTSGRSASYSALAKISFAYCGIERIF